MQTTGQVSEKIQAAMAAEITALGYEFWGVEFRREQGKLILRVFIEQENGIQLDDCSKVSRGLSAWLDVEDPFDGSYYLEVSSPGIDRPLFRLDQFRRFENHPVRIETRQSIESRKKWKGIITSVTDETVHLQVAEETIAIPFSNILKARLVLE